MFKLTFLGTSAGTPTKYRNVSGLAVECLNPYLAESNAKSKKNRPWILVDCGEGTQHQLLHTKLSVHELQAICITHVHGDHCYGLAGLLASMAMSGRKAPLKLIAPKAIGKLLDTLTITTELYFPYDIEFIAIEDLLTTDLLTTDFNEELTKNQKTEQPPKKALLTLAFTDTHHLDIELTALSHRVVSVAFSFTQHIERVVLNSEKLLAKGIEPCNTWGKLKHGHDATLETGEVLKSVDYVNRWQEKVKLVVSGDNDTPELLTETIKGATLLVHESTYTQVVADKIKGKEDGFDPQHSSAKQVAEFAQRNQLPHMILTHFSARYQLFDDVTSKLSNMGDIREEVEMYYHGGFKQQFWLAEDFDEYEVGVDTVRRTGYRK